jgi:bifunctional non-homologous end joining protein LigD
LFVFDVLRENGGDLRRLTLSERKQCLQCILPPVPGMRVSDYVPTYGDALFAVITEHDYEGVVAKRLDAPYRAGRQPTWQKIKNPTYSRREAFVWRA